MKALCDLLAHSDNDYWSDVLADEARVTLDSMGFGVFAELRQMWRGLTEVQQEHLAYILDGGISNEEDQLIVDMLESPHKDVSFRAWEAQQNKTGEQDTAGQSATVE